MKPISLSESEIKICSWLAKNRYTNNRASSITDGKIGPQSVELTDLEGVCGEFAVCKYLNIYPDLSIHVRKGGEDGLLKKLSFDVKTTKYKTGKLIASITKSTSETNIYILVIGFKGEYTIVGWCFAIDLFKDENITDLGYGPVYGLSQDRLNVSIDDLKSINVINT